MSSAIMEAYLILLNGTTDGKLEVDYVRGAVDYSSINMISYILTTILSFWDVFKLRKLCCRMPIYLEADTNFRSYILESKI